MSETIFYEELFQSLTIDGWNSRLDESIDTYICGAMLWDSFHLSETANYMAEEYGFKFSDKIAVNYEQTSRAALYILHRMSQTNLVVPPYIKSNRYADGVFNLIIPWHCPVKLPKITFDVYKPWVHKHYDYVYNQGTLVSQSITETNRHKIVRKMFSMGDDPIPISAFPIHYFETRVTAVKENGVLIVKSLDFEDANPPMEQEQVLDKPFGEVVEYCGRDMG